MKMFNKYTSSELLNLSRIFIKKSIDISDLIKQALKNDEAVEILFDYILETKPQIIEDIAYDWVSIWPYLINNLNNPEITITVSSVDKVINYIPYEQNLSFEYVYASWGDLNFQKNPFTITGGNPPFWTTYPIYSLRAVPLDPVNEDEIFQLTSSEIDKISELNKKFNSEWHFPLFNLAIKLHKMSGKAINVK